MLFLRKDSLTLKGRRFGKARIYRLDKWFSGLELYLDF